MNEIFLLSIIAIVISLAALIHSYSTHKESKFIAAREKLVTYKGEVLTWKNVLKYKLLEVESFSSKDKYAQFNLGEITESLEIMIQGLDRLDGALDQQLMNRSYSKAEFLELQAMAASHQFLRHDSEEAVKDVDKVLERLRSLQKSRAKG